jgi:hypothetical protein
LQAKGGELGGDVFPCQLVPASAGTASFKEITRQEPIVRLQRRRPELRERLLNNRGNCAVRWNGIWKGLVLSSEAKAARSEQSGPG